MKGELFDMPFQRLNVVYRREQRIQVAVLVYE